MNDTESESKFDKLVSVTSLSQHRPAFSSTRIRQRRFETALLFAGSLSARPLVNTPVPLQYTTNAAAVCLLHPGACRPLVECPHPRAMVRFARNLLSFWLNSNKITTIRPGECTHITPTWWTGEPHWSEACTSVQRAVFARVLGRSR